MLSQAYQLFKARAYGADAVLLIAAVLPTNDLEYLIAAAKKIGLQSLIEVGTCNTQLNYPLDFDHHPLRHKALRCAGVTASEPEPGHCP